MERQSSTESPSNSSSSLSNPLKWTYHHFIVFVLTFFGYSLFHATRKTFSNVKTTISEQWSPTNLSQCDVYDFNIWNKHDFFPSSASAGFFLGALDTVFMSCYALGLYLSGFIGDRFNMRIVLSCGMWLSAITLFLFGTLSEWLQIYNEGYYITFWALNGLFQSSGWPITVAIMGNWFGKSSRGVVFGLWGACTSVGNIIGAYLVASVLTYGYQYAFLVPACLLFAGGIVIFFSLVPRPTDLGLPMADSKPCDIISINNESAEPLLNNLSDSGMEEDESLIELQVEEKAISIIEALCLPGVFAYSLGYACLKMVNYSFFFWLPYYLSIEFHWDQKKADEISTWYDVGGIVGAVVTGFISDRMERRSPTVMMLLLVSPIALIVYTHSPANKIENAALMSLVGFFVNGAANIVSTAVAADLGRQPALNGNSRALATVTGIIDGTGSAGAAAGMLIISPLSTALGWKAVFYAFIIMMLLTAVCILPIFIRDVKFYWNQRQSRREMLAATVSEEKQYNDTVENA